MGRRGPVPKRSNQKRFTGGPKVEQIVLPASTVEPPPLRPGLHPFAVVFYEDLAKSGQARFYEPSDWRAAQLLCEAIDEYMGKRRAATLASVLALFSRLGVTEGDRRRMQVELVRGNAKDEQQAAEATIHDLFANVSKSSS